MKTKITNVNQENMPQTKKLYSHDLKNTDL